MVWYVDPCQGCSIFYFIFHSNISKIYFILLKFYIFLVRGLKERWVKLLKLMVTYINIGNILELIWSLRFLNGTGKERGFGSDFGEIYVGFAPDDTSRRNNKIHRTQVYLYRALFPEIRENTSLVRGEPDGFVAHLMLI